MIKLHGLKISYFTGKLESYLRYKEIPFEFRSMTATLFTSFLPKETGAMQMPAVELPDGRWMTDTSPIIDWFEAEHPEPPILPSDPVQAFLCRLIEDYADEWLWRPAMHYRWSYPATAKLLRRQIVDEMTADIPLPAWMKRIQVERRQRANFVRGDGVDDATRDHVEQGYLRALEILQPIVDSRPFLFGARPTLADIGLLGPMLRHFSMDPAPAAIMRETAPAVMAWVYRLWNARASRIAGDALNETPADLSPLLREIAETHLENLCANAAAWGAGGKRYEARIQGAHYRNLPVSRYRVWCLEKLQERLRETPDAARPALEAMLDRHDCLEPLRRIEKPDSGYDPERRAPFGKSIPVYENVRN